MRKMVITLLALGVFAASSAFAANAVRISALYGGGGSASGYYTGDYVELFNSSGSPVNIGGWSLQYNSTGSTSVGGPGGTATYSNAVIFPTGATVQPCGYYLVQTGTASANGLNVQPTAPDIMFWNLTMSGTIGKIVLMDNAVNPTVCPSGSFIGSPAVDAVGWASGSITACIEGANAGATTVSSGIFRKLNGMQDTDVNSADFVVTAAPFILRNSASAPSAECMIVPTTSRTWGQVKTIYR